MSMTGRFLLVLFVTCLAGAVAIAAQGTILYLLWGMTMISGVAFALAGGEEHD